MKLSAPVKEAVADVQVEISQEEAPAHVLVPLGRRQIAMPGEFLKWAAPRARAAKASSCGSWKP